MSRRYMQAPVLFVGTPVNCSISDRTVEDQIFEDVHE